MQDIRIHRGDIFWVRQDYAAVGSEARKNRPAIIVSNEKNNTYSGTVYDGQAIDRALRSNLHGR